MGTEMTLKTKMVTLFILLGMAATSRARLDVFQTVNSKNQDIHNHAVEVHTKSSLIPIEEKSGRIPYLECIKICDNCACTKMWPPESNTCVCLDNHDVEKVTSIQSSEAVEVHTKTGLIPTEEKSGRIPYLECIKICDNCACTKMWPPEANTCVCLDNRDVEKATSIQSSEVAEVTIKSDLVPTQAKSSGGIPYPECIKICDHCACTLIWPIEKSICVCIPNPKTDSNVKRPTNIESGKRINALPIQMN